MSVCTFKKIWCSEFCLNLKFISFFFRGLFTRLCVVFIVCFVDWLPRISVR